MRALTADGPTLVDRPVEIYDIMVSYAGKAALTVPAVYVGDCHVTARGSGGAVYDDAVDLSHSSFFPQNYTASHRQKVR